MVMVGTANIAKLRKQFKKANQRVDKAKARYQKLVSVLYMPWGKDGKIVNVGMVCIRRYDNLIVEYATDLSWTFYRRGRGGKIYEKPQTENKKHCEVCNGSCYAACPYRHSDELVSQDYLDLCKLEYAIDAAVDERARLIDELKAVGVNVFFDAELWQ